MATQTERMVLEVTEKGVAQTQAKLAGLNTSLIGIGVASAALVGVGKFLANGIKEAAQAEVAFTKVAQAVKSTGGAAGLTSNSLAGIANELEKINAIDADNIMEQVTAPLLTFTKVSNQVFGEAQQAIIDLSRLLDGDLKGATLQVGKALNDPIKGVAALTRVGVSFTQEQKDMIKALVESNRSLEAQKIILKELNTEFGGQGAAYAQTYAGKLDAMKISTDNLAQSFGELTISPINFFIVKLTESFDDLQESINSIKESTGIYQTTGSAKELLASLREVNEELAKDEYKYGWSRKKQNLHASQQALINELKQLSANQYGKKENIAIIEKTTTAIAEQVDWLAEWGKVMTTTAQGAQTLSQYQQQMTNTWQALTSEYANDKWLKNLNTKTDELKEEVEKVTTVWQEFANDMQQMTEGQIANALNIMILSHESAFNKLQSIMHSFVNAMINELNRYIAKLVVAFAIQQLLGLINPASYISKGLAGANPIGAQMPTSPWSMPTQSVPTIRPGQKPVDVGELVNQIKNRPVIVYVDPREISKANELGTALR